MNIRPLFTLSFVILLASSGGSMANAQGIPSAVGGLELSVSVNNPAPGQTVTITAASYASSIDSAVLTWTAGGKTLARGAGVKSISLQAPALGKHIVVNVTAVTPDGETFTNSVTLGSGSVDMIVEPDGYMPPFFPGKLPTAYQNSVTIIAVPHIADYSGNEYDPATLVYSWKQNETVLQDHSGYGKQSVTLASSIVPRPYTVTVTAATRSGNDQAVGVMTIAPSSPSLAFYSDDPLYGPLLNRALGSTVYLGAQREMGVLVVPYGFNGLTNGDLGLSWTINGTGHPELDGNDVITLRAPDSAGSSAIRLDASNQQDILQQGNGQFSVDFSAATSTQHRSASF